MCTGQRSPTGCVRPGPASHCLAASKSCCTPGQTGAARFGAPAGLGLRRASCAATLRCALLQRHRRPRRRHGPRGTRRGLPAEHRSRGGAATRQRYGREHYAEIGRKGGQAGRGRKRPRQPADETELPPSPADRKTPQTRPQRFPAHATPGARRRHSVLPARRDLGRRVSVRIVHGCFEPHSAGAGWHHSHMQPGPIRGCSGPTSPQAGPSRRPPLRRSRSFPYAADQPGLRRRGQMVAPAIFVAAARSRLLER